MYPTQQEYPQQQGGAPMYPTQQPQYIPGPPPVQQFQYQTNKSSFETIKEAIPVLPMCMAVFCLVVNCVLPGVGSMIAAFALLCCSNTEDVKTGKIGLFCINFWVGVAQLVTLVFGIGWVWSIFWGFLYLHAASGKDLTEEVTVVQREVPVVSPDAVYPKQATAVPTASYNNAGVV